MTREILLHLKAARALFALQITIDLRSIILDWNFDMLMEQVYVELKVLFPAETKRALATLK